jgi:hypothetical protein
MQIPIPPTPERLLGSAVGMGVSKGLGLLGKLGAPDLDRVEAQMAEARAGLEARAPHSPVLD